MTIEQRKNYEKFVRSWVLENKLNPLDHYSFDGYTSWFASFESDHEHRYFMITLKRNHTRFYLYNVYKGILLSMAQENSKKEQT